uniref:Branched-chain amino acid ABC-type transport system, permease component n=1 Tax=Candidatus Kentrum sp. LFY TaxID=2126342 RepID=A0A450WDF2_9GAMM|nr:MAG: Branched-chain amino acid ABC-type transport system, permease component [Candidatus Kentron sp. LFY]
MPEYLLLDMLYSGVLMGLISTGFFISLKYCKVFLMSYGGIVLSGAYIATLVQPSVVGWLIALCIAACAGAFLGGGHYLLLRSGLRKQQSINSILLTWGVALIFAEFYRIVFGPAGRFAPAIFDVSSSDAMFPATRVIILSVAMGILFLIFVFAFFLRTIRLRFEALAEDHRTAAEYGVPITRYLIISFALTGLIGGVSGVLLSQDNAITPYLGVQFTIQAALAGLIVGPRLIQGFIAAFSIGAGRVFLGFNFGITEGWLMVLGGALFFAVLNKAQGIRYGN